MEHYYSENQKSRMDLKKIKQIISGSEFEFYTASGVFSKTKVDKGTLALAESMQISRNDKVLDIGCGIGILGIVAAKLFEANAVMSDVNKRAVMLAKKNLDLNGVKGEVFEGSLYENIKDNDFDVVLSNPPQNAGKEICFRVIKESKNHLKSTGSLQLVARHNKGGKTLSKKMHEVFGNLETISKSRGYWVYKSVKYINNGENKTS